MHNWHNVANLALFYLQCDSNKVVKRGGGGPQVKKFEQVHSGDIGTPWTDRLTNMTENVAFTRQFD